MKIPRYSTGRSNVGLLEQGRSALRSPREAAAAAGAKYQAGVDIAGSVAESVFLYDKVKQENQKADDKLVLTRQSLETSTAIDKVYNDAAENNWTAEELEEELVSVIDASDAVLAELQHPENKRDMPTNLKLAKESLWETNRSKIIDYGIKRSTSELNAQWETAVQAKDVVTLSNLLSFAGDEEFGLKNPEQIAEWTSELDNLLIDEEATEIASEVELGYITGGMEKGEEEYDKLVNNTTMDADKKAAALVKAGVHRANFIRSQVDDRARENVAATMVVTVNSELAKSMQFSHDENMVALQTGEYGDPDGQEATNRWASVYRSIEAAKRAGSTVVDVSTAVAAGQILDPTNKNRDGLDGYVDVHVDATGMEVDEDEYFRFVADLSQTTGLLPQRERSGINSGVVSVEMAKKFLPLYEYLNDNNLLAPDLGLTDKAETMYSSVSALTKYGVSADDAIQTYLDAKDLTTEDKEALLIDYDKESSPSGAFSDVINSEFFAAADPFFDLRLSPETETKMELRYNAVRQEVYMATGGNITVADEVAEKSIKRGWGASNFGSSDPDDYTIQEDPLGHDMSEFQDQLITDLNGQNIIFQAYSDDGKFGTTKTLEPESITFHRIPQLEGEGRDGVRRYQVWSNGRPVVNLDTQRVVDFPITSAQAKNISRISSEKTVRGNEVERVTDRIAEIEDIIKTPATRQKYRRTKLKEELEGLKRELPNAIKRRDALTYVEPDLEE